MSTRAYWFPILITRCHTRLRTMYVVMGLLAALSLILTTILIVLATSTSSCEGQGGNAATLAPEGDSTEPDTSGSHFPYVPTRARV